MLALFFVGRIQTSNRAYLEMYNQLCKTHTVVVFCSLNKNANDPQCFIDTFRRDLSIGDDQFNIESMPDIQHIVKYKKAHESSYTNTFSMFFHFKRCFELIKDYETKHHVQFDILLRFRTEIHGNFALPDVQPYTLYIPHGNDYGGVNDQIALGDTYAMQVYCNCVDFLMYSLTKENVNFHPETLLKAHLNRNRVPIVRFDFSYHLKR